MCFYGKLKPVDLDIPKDKLFACTVISSSDILNIFSTLIQCYNIHFQVHVCYKALFLTWDLHVAMVQGEDIE